MKFTGFVSALLEWAYPSVSVGILLIRNIVSHTTIKQKL